MNSEQGVYLIENQVTGKVYVGSSSNCKRRFSEHRSKLARGAHINRKLQASWIKHGGEAFSFKVVANVLVAEHLAAVEQELIDSYQAVEKGYNLAPEAGNTRGWKAPEDTRRRMSEAAKKRDNSVQVEAMRKASKGKKRPAYVIAAMQQGRRNKPITQETRDRMAKAAVARSRYSQDDRRRMAEMHKEGVPYREIAKRFGLAGHDAVMKYVKRWLAENQN